MNTKRNGIILGLTIFVFILFLSIKFNFFNIFLGIIITFISYFIYPFIKFKIICIDNDYSNLQIKRTLVLNSIFVAITYVTLTVLLFSNKNYKLEFNFMPAAFYYVINKLIFFHRD